MLSHAQAASYADLTAELPATTLHSWIEQAKDDPKLADFIWFAYAQGYGCTLNPVQARAWHKRSDGPLAKLFEALSFRNRHWVRAYEEHDFKTDNKRCLDLITEARHRFVEQLNDDPGATVWLGVCDVEYRRPSGIKYLEEAADLGFADAHAWLGYHYTYIKKDHKKALHHYQLAADKQVHWAHAQLAEFHHRGWGTKRDRNKAEQLFKQAAQAGEPRAMYRYAQFNGNDNTRLAMLIESFEIGMADAAGHLAWRYENGRGAKLDIAQAIAVHKKQYQKFVITERWRHYALRASLELGRLHQRQAEQTNGETQRQHYTHARSWYENVLSNSSNPKDYHVLRAHLGLGLFERDGLAGPVDYQAAFSHLQKAASGNVPEAQSYLGDAYRLGQGCNKDLKQAQEHYETALKRLKGNHPQRDHTQFMIAQCVEAELPQKAQDLYRNYSKNGNAKASYRLYQIYTQHNKPDEAKASLAMAAKQGHQHAQQEIEARIRQADAAILDNF